MQMRRQPFMTVSDSGHHYCKTEVDYSGMSRMVQSAGSEDSVEGGSSAIDRGDEVSVVIPELQGSMVEGAGRPASQRRA